MTVGKTEEESTIKSSPGYTTVEKVVKTVFLVLTWVMIGLFTEITGPTQKDLIIKTDSNYELVSRATSGRSVGYFVGAVIGGPLVDKLGKYCDVMIALCLDGAALATFAAPYATNVNLLWFLLMLGGTFEGIINIAGQKIILNLWKERSAGPLHVLHFGFGMGSFIVPQIANPFLAVLAPSDVNSTETTVNSSTSPLPMTTTIALNATQATDKYLKESRIELAYLIVSITVAALSVVFYIYQFCSRTFSEKVVNEKDESKIRKVVKLIDPGTCTNGDRIFGVQVFVLLFLYYFNEVGGSRLYGKFIRSYSIDKHKFSGDDGSLLNTEYWICYAVGRFTGLFTGRFIPIRILILLEVFGMFCMAILLNIFARDNDLALWILTAPMGFLMGPLFPSGIAWGDFHVEFTGFAITFVLMGGALGGMAYLWIIGYLYQYHGYDMFLNQLIAYGVLMVILTILLTIVGKRHGGRFEKDENEMAIESSVDQHNDMSISTNDIHLPPSYLDIVHSNVKPNNENRSKSNENNSKL